jgi:thiol:disulfide interchange protein
MSPPRAPGDARGAGARGRGARVLVAVWAQSGVIGCAASPPAPEVEVAAAVPASASASAAPPMAPPAKPEEGSIAWITSDARAFALAKSGRQPLLVLLCAGWATPCVAAERTLWKSAAIARAAAPFVPLRIDLTDDDTTSRGLAERYAVDAVPTVLLLDHEGRELERLKGMPDEPELLEALARAAAR